MIELDRTLLWDWPAADCADWLTLVGTAAAVQSHAEYQTLLAAVQADLEQQGLRVVVRVSMTVAEMRAALARHRQPNTPDGRAAAQALHYLWQRTEP